VKVARGLVIGAGRGSIGSHQTRSQTTKMSRVGNDGGLNPGTLLLSSISHAISSVLTSSTPLT
jgi:hypothetical protein